MLLRPSCPSTLPKAAAAASTPGAVPGRMMRDRLCTFVHRARAADVERDMEALATREALASVTADRRSFETGGPALGGSGCKAGQQGNQLGRQDQQG
jgi:hypothetical protein